MTRIINVELSVGDNGEKDPNDYALAGKSIQDAVNKAGEGGNPFACFDQFTISDEQLDAIAEPEWIYPHLLGRGFMTVWCAKPNGGKTAIAEYVSRVIAKDWNVIWLQGDLSGSQAKQAILRAKQYGYKYYCPDFKAGKSMGKAFELLTEMNESGGDFSRTILIVDTLKKLVDSTIAKGDMVKAFKVLRGLTVKGLTILLLHHTKKYDVDGKPVFEGTNEVITDVDELFYLISAKNPDGSLIVTTEPEKKRGQAQQLTFEISAKLSGGVDVREIPFVDAVQVSKEQQQYFSDKELIEAIVDVLSDGEMNQGELIDAVRAETNDSKKRVSDVVKRYVGKYWQRTKNREENNKWIYRKGGGV